MPHPFLPNASLVRICIALVGQKEDVYSKGRRKKRETYVSGRRDLDDETRDEFWPI